ncbi:MAG TPA: hypothetical protein P5243_03005 [Bacteroidales bacterium]|nr:hypothetical protein [Bacteroidales bacterium]HRS18449.1 hypothetical protein [Bacteroidales bacterium]
MTVKKNELQTMSLTVTEGLTVTILPSLSHQFLMTTKEVANGYGTSKYAIQQAFHRNSSELIEGKHFVTALTYCQRDSKLPHNAILFTKRGIVRLGFFIKSERAKLFRDWAEDLIIAIDNHDNQKNLFGEIVTTQRQLPTKRKHNRLTHERLLNIMADVCKIENSELRLAISTKLMQGGVQ